MQKVLGQVKQLKLSNTKLMDTFNVSGENSTIFIRFQSSKRELKEVKREIRDKDKNMYSSAFKDFDEVNLYKALREHEREQIKEEDEQRRRDLALFRKNQHKRRMECK